jgi:hypothetical protein
MVCCGISIESSLDFNIAPRGEIFLTGKGNKPAYLVIPPTPFTYMYDGAAEGL